MGATSASAWKKNKGPETKELPLPSGNVCLVQTIDPQAMLTAGYIPNALLSEVMTLAMQTAGMEDKDAEVDASALMNDIVANPEKLSEMMGMADAITLAVVVEPKVLPVPHWTEDDFNAGRCAAEVIGQVKPENARDDNVLYIDQVDLNDKMYIFQHAVGGPADLTSFRDELASGVAALADGQAAGGAAE